MPELTYVGKPATRVDALEKVLGTAKYIADYRMPGVLHARCLRSDLPHARIVRLDVTPALRVPGVVAAITSEDFVDHGRFGYPVDDMFMLAHERVRYVGDAIAAVAAETEEALAAGLAAIDLELEPLPAVFDPVEALKPDAPVIGEKRWDSPDMPRGNLLTRHIVRQGDAEGILAACDVTLDEEYSTAHQEHAYLETEGALAMPAPGPDPSPVGTQGKGVVVYSSNQSPYLNRDNLCRVLGLPPAQVRVIQPQVGGAFGGKDDLLYQTSGQVARLALITGRPVRMVFSREESMIASYKRDAMQMHIRLGADRDGRLRSAAIHATVDSGAYASITPFTAWRSSIHAMGPYRYEACTVDTDVAYTNNGYSGAFRGFGNTEVCAGIEQAIDQLAHRLGIDPIDFRLSNCLRPGDETPHGQKLGNDVALAECLEQVRRDSDWDRKRKEYGAPPIPAGDQQSAISDRPSDTRNGLLRRGIGVAAVFHGISLGAEGEDFAVCRIAVNEDCSLTLSAGLTDYGTGSRTVYTLIAAETLGLQPGRIEMPRPDTASEVNSGPTVASRATVLGGNATRVAAENLNAMLVAAAADLLGCDLAQVLREGERYIGPSEEPASFEEVAAHARRRGIELTALGRWNSPDNHWSFETGQGKPYFAYHFGAQVAEVLVDTGTGKVEVTGIWAAHNAGKVIFPQGALGQLIGGITQGLGYALMERVDFDGGYMQATNFDEYLIPTAMDVPDMTGRFIEVPFSAGPFGAKNIGEPGMVPAAPAILNAIFHATGRRIHDLPATLERVLLGHDLRPTGSSRACKLGLKTA
jgi:CO/xanthine dehydrogenase Mo-binding subunit